MSGRSKWIGLKSISAKEVKKYSLKNVFDAPEKWNPKK